MLTTLLGSALVSNNWIDLGQSNGEFFSIYSEFQGFPYDTSRVAYIREVFGPNQYSARWIRLWLRHGETHVFRALDFAGYNRLFQMRSEWAGNLEVDFYEVDPGIVSIETRDPGLRAEYYNNDVLVHSEIVNDLQYDYGSNGTPHPSVGSPFRAVYRGFIEIPANSGLTFWANTRNSFHQSYFEIRPQLTGAPLFSGDARQLQNQGPFAFDLGMYEFRFEVEHGTNTRLGLEWTPSGTRELIPDSALFN